MASLSMQHIYKIYTGGVTAVSDFTLDIEDKEFIVLVGPSCFGKSTTLKRFRRANCTSATSWSTTSLPRIATSPWFSRTTPCIPT